ncbi:MAG: methyltransferase domain-containing protein [Gemmatimonadetes bacterium]|nr:methyltransferase domain-containing protein [Gemmatimonadota bacterium]
MSASPQAAGGEDVRQHREWLLGVVRLPPGGTLVDLGCGTGDDVLALAARNADPAAHFLGIDAAGDSVAAGRARTGGDPRIGWGVHRLAGTVPLASGSVDAVFSHNLLECVADPDAFAREVGRVLRPGGTAVVAHWDFDSQVFDGSDRAAVRAMVHAFAEWRQPWMEHADGWMGRRLHGVFARTGLFEGTVHARVLINTTYAKGCYGHARVQDLGRMVRRGLVATEAYERFVRDQEALARDGRYFYGITGYAYAGRRLG